MACRETVLGALGITKAAFPAGFSLFSVQAGSPKGWLTPHPCTGSQPHPQQPWPEPSSSLPHLPEVRKAPELHTVICH